MSTRSPRLPWLLLAALTAFIFGCRGGERNSPAGEGGAGSSAAAGAPGRRVVLFVGTSLTAAHGLDPEQGFPALIQTKIDSAGLPFEVVNAGVSGETSRGARERMRWLLNQPFDVLVLETGANDMLRGTSLRSLRQNVAAIVDTVKAARPQARVVLAGMLAAPNLGERYGEEFRAVYADV
ncbi:MAG TPA: GDSL-type esterase/lipase family protein, partial [Longimicrobiaceae bacterium]|nr:GDSL-type esterase/lipase family protein [Longimicrobiaceae bacterium]